MGGMKKHPEDSNDWSDYVNKRDEWTLPSPQPGQPQDPHANPAHDGPVGPYGAMDSPWKDYDDRDPQPPRESTPYDETNPFTNHAAWRYQQNPYRGDPQEHRSDYRRVLFTGLGLGIALIVIALLAL